MADGSEKTGKGRIELIGNAAAMSNYCRICCLVGLCSNSEKMTMKVMISALLASLVLAGCVDPRSYESTPVKVKTPQGVVTCQLYTKERVLWDRAIDMPRGMSVAAGDQICLNEGARWKYGG